MGVNVAGSARYSKTGAFATGDVLTFMLWARPTGNPSSGGYNNLIVCNLPGTQFGFGIDTHNVAGTTKWSIGTNNSDFDGANVTLNTWAHLALIRNGNTKTLYLNGVQTATGSDIATAQTGLYIGDDDTSAGGAWVGDMADILVYKGVALTVDQIIAQMMGGSRPRSTASIYGYWPMFGTGEDEIDFSGNGNTLTVGGTPTYADGPPRQLYNKKPIIIFAVASGNTTFTQSLSGSVTVSGSLTKAAAKAFTGSLSPSGLFTKKASKTMTGSITPSGALSLAKTLVKSLVGSITISGSTVIKAISKTLTGSITTTGSVTKQASKTLTGSVTPSGALTLLKVKLLALVGSITVTGSNVIKAVSKTLTGSITPAGTVTKQTSKTLTGSVSPSGSLTFIRSFVRTLTGAIVVTGVLTKQVSKPLVGAITTSGSLAKKIFKTLTGSVTLAGSWLAIVVGAGAVKAFFYRVFILGRRS